MICNFFLEGKIRYDKVENKKENKKWKIKEKEYDIGNRRHANVRRAAIEIENFCETKESAPGVIVAICRIPIRLSWVLG